MLSNLNQRACQVVPTGLFPGEIADKTSYKELATVSTEERGTFSIWLLSAVVFSVPPIPNNSLNFGWLNSCKWKLKGKL